MINAISFMGKEGCIEPAKNAVKNVAKKTNMYIGKEPHGFDKGVEKTATEAIRKADIQSYQVSHSNINLPAAEKINPKVAVNKYEATKSFNDSIQPGIPLN